MTTLFEIVLVAETERGVRKLRRRGMGRREAFVRARRFLGDGYGVEVWTWTQVPLFVDDEVVCLNWQPNRRIY